MIKIPGMIMVGAGDRNAGKTEFVCSLIRKFSGRHEIIGIKITPVNEDNTGCPRGAESCGVCGALEGDYCITEETDSTSGKDTCRMLSAGAAKVFWLRALRTHLEKGAMALQELIGDDAVSVCESNTLRLVVEPGLFVMLKNRGSKKHKASAEKVAQYADREIVFDGNEFDIEPDEIKLIDGKWTQRIDDCRLTIDD